MRTLTILAAAALIGMSSGSALADPVTECGALQAKAEGALFQALFKEAARACGGGANGAPLAVRRQAAAVAVAKFDVKIAKAVDEFLAANCRFDIGEITSVSLRQSMQSMADMACLVP